MLRRLFAIVALLCLSAPLAQAHASWIAERAGDYAVIHGHGASDEAYDPARVTAASGLDAAGNPVVVNTAPQAKNVLLQPAEGAAVLSAVWDEGWWTEDAQGEWHNAPPEGFAGFKNAGKYSTFVVSYIGLTEVQEPLGYRLEILPLADPGKLGIGDKLPVQVLMDSKPLPGVVVTNDVLTDWDLNSGLTDAEGKTVITVANSGLNVAQIFHETPIGENRVEGLQAVLSFTSGLNAE